MLWPPAPAGERPWACIALRPAQLQRSGLGEGGLAVNPRAGSARIRRPVCRHPAQHPTVAVLQAPFSAPVAAALRTAKASHASAKRATSSLWES